MKKTLFILSLLISLFASAQKLQYVNTYGYDYNKFKVRDLFGLPTDTFTVPADLLNVPFICNKSGSIYLWNIVTHVWDLFSGGGGSTETASEGLTKISNDIRFGGVIGTPGIFTSERALNVNRKIMHWTNGVASTSGGPSFLPTFPLNINWSPYQFISSDTVTVTGQTDAVPTVDVPFAGIYASRQIYFADGIIRTQKIFGHNFQTQWNWKDTFSLDTRGGDYNVPFKVESMYLPRGTGRQGIRASHGTGQTNSIYYAAPALLVNTLFNNSAGNYIKVNGHLSGVNSYLVMGNVNPDTLGRFVFYTTGGFVSAGSNIGITYDFAPAFNYPGFAGYVDSAYFLYDTLTNKRTYFAGRTVLGNSKNTSHTWSSSDQLKVIGNVNITDSLKVGNMINWNDSTNIDIVLSPRTAGGHALRKIRFDQLATILGSGGGSGTVNSGLINTLAYYPATGTTVDDLTAITANSLLASDANGLPVAVSGVSDVEAGHLNGVTSGIQGQIDSKLSSSALSLVKGFMVDTLTLSGSATLIPQYIWLDEFQGSSTNTAGSSYTFELVSGTGANAAAVANASTISGATGYGYAEINTGTTTTGKAILNGGVGATNNNQMGKVDNDYYYRLSFKNVIFNDLSNGTETYKSFMGFGVDNANTNGIWFTYTDSENSGVFNCRSYNNTTVQTTNTATTVVADTEYDLDIEYYNQTAKFYINGTLVATHATQVPPAAGVMQAPLFKILKSAGTIARIIYLDALFLRITHENNL